MRKENIVLKKIVISAMFLAIAVSLNTLSSFYIPLFGANSVRVSFGGVFTLFPSILFGPLYGAVVGGLSDLIGYILKPTGAYIPFLTLTAALGGALQGFLWMLLKKKNDRSLRIIMASTFTIIGIYGIISHISLSADGIMNGLIAFEENMPTREATNLLLGGGTLAFPTRVVILFAQFAKPGEYAAELAMYSNMLTIGPEILALSGLAITLLRFKKTDKANIGVSPFTFTAVMLISRIVISTLNTVILMIYIPSLAQRAFMLLWIPRIIKEVFVCAVQSYIAIALYGVYIKTTRKLRAGGDDDFGI